MHVWNSNFLPGIAHREVRNTTAYWYSPKCVLHCGQFCIASRHAFLQENVVNWNIQAPTWYSGQSSCLMLKINDFKCYEARKWKGLQFPGVESRIPLAWAASALPLSHDSQATINPHHPLHVLHSGARCYSLPPVQSCRGLWEMVVVRLLCIAQWQSISSSSQGVLGWTPGNCLPFHFPLF